MLYTVRTVYGGVPRWVVAILLSTCVWAITLSAADIGTRIDRFTLPDFHGRTRSLDELADKSLVVVAFLGTECPLARQYAPQPVWHAQRSAHRTQRCRADTRCRCRLGQGELRPARR